MGLTPSQSYYVIVIFLSVEGIKGRDHLRVTESAVSLQHLPVDLMQWI
jgi:hypothetical protein